MSSSFATSLVNDLRAALWRLAEAPLVTETVLAAAEDLDKSWERTPWSFGIRGADLAARTELVNLACGESLFDPSARKAGCATFVIRTGETLSFVAKRQDDSTERASIPVIVSTEAKAAAMRKREAGLRATLAAKETEAGELERALPAILRSPPKWWQWPVRWVLSLVKRKALAAWRAATGSVSETRRLLAGAEDFSTTNSEHERAEREKQIARLRQLATSTSVLLIELEVPPGTLPAGVEIVELAGASSAADVDAIVEIGTDGCYAQSANGRMRIGAARDLLPRLPELLAQTRALRLARRARDKLAKCVESLDGAIESAETNFKLRLDRFEAFRMVDPAGFAAQQLQRVQPKISASIQAVLEHANVHLGTELAELANTSINSITNAASSDQLKAAASHIDETWTATTKRIADEVRILVMGGAEGSAYDLIPELIATLLPFGLPEAEVGKKRAKPKLEAVELLPSLVRPAAVAKVGGTKQWLAGLFRSFDTKRSNVREQVQARVEQLKDVAGSEMLDAEPLLRSAINYALETELNAAIARQRAWLDAAIAAERATIDRERVGLADITSTRARAASDCDALAAVIAKIESELPAIAAVTAA